MWFRVDDSLAFHPKVVAAGPALALWLRAAAWSAQQLTDGHVPAAMLPALGSKAHARRLVDVGLWEDAAEGGWRFHDWAEYQRSGDQVRVDRAVAADRQALVRNPHLREVVRRRDSDRCRYCRAQVKWKDRRSEAAGTYDVVIPERGVHVDNVVVACRNCTTLKGRRTPAEAGLTLAPAAAAQVSNPAAAGRPQSAPGSDLDTRLDPTQVVGSTSPVLSCPVPSSLREEEGTGGDDVAGASPADAADPTSPLTMLAAARQQARDGQMRLASRARPVEPRLPTAAGPRISSRLVEPEHPAQSDDTPVAAVR